MLKKLGFKKIYNNDASVFATNIINRLIKKPSSKKALTKYFNKVNNKAAEQGGFDLSKSTVYHSTNLPSIKANDISSDAKAKLVLSKGLKTGTNVETGVKHEGLGRRAYVSAGGPFAAHIYDRTGKTTVKAKGLKQRGYIDVVDAP